MVPLEDMGKETTDPEVLRRIEAKLDRLLAIYERFAPLLERLGGGIFGKAITPRRIGEPSVRKQP